MKVFTDLYAANKSYETKKSYWLNSKCPRVNNGTKFCGNWCALFHIEENTDHTSANVILGCKAGEKMLYIENIVGDENVSESTMQ